MLAFGGPRVTRPSTFAASYFGFLSGRWVRADAAAVFAALLDFGLRRTFEAAEAALRLVTSPILFLAM